MKTRPAFVAVLLLVSSALGGPTARDVVVRGGSDLSDALAAATRDAWVDRESSRPVAIVVDVTPHTRAALGRLRGALDNVGDRISHLDGIWRVGALGRKLSEPVRHPSALLIELARVMGEETPEVNTLRALRKTLGGFSDRGGIVVYLADWRFEDDDDVEGLISKLTGRGQSLRVIGSEACFGRAWNDGIPRFALDPEEREEGIGRSPFGPREPDAPWHGGDTAYPHAPYSFGNHPWKTEFPLPLLPARGEGGRGGFENLAERLGGAKVGGGGFRTYPLASAFGPYALMRAAGMTGGTYRLYSWNPSGRIDVVYDYAKCNLFEPDLRSRREILADARRHPLPSAMLKVWQDLSDPGVRVVDLTPPLERSGGPGEIGRVSSGRDLMYVWPEKADHESFLSESAKRLRNLDDAIRTMDRALASPARRDGPWPRYHADARLLHHTLRVLRFQLAEARAAAGTVPANAWEDEKTMPAVTEREWIEPGGVETTRARLYDAAAGEEIREERGRHLETYGGTPFGEIVSRNPVVTYVYRRVPKPVDLADARPGRTPSESNPDGTTTPRGGGSHPGGSSGGGGAASGK